MSQEREALERIVRHIEADQPMLADIRHDQRTGQLTAQGEALLLILADARAGLGLLP